MSTAKAVVLTMYGPPEVLVWSDVPMSEPGPGQVRIRVKAAGVSPSDPKIRRSLFINGQFYSGSYDARPLVAALKSSVAQGDR